MAVLYVAVLCRNVVTGRPLVRSCAFDRPTPCLYLVWNAVQFFQIPVAEAAWAGTTLAPSRPTVTAAAATDFEMMFTAQTIGPRDAGE